MVIIDEGDNHLPSANATNIPRNTSRTHYSTQSAPPLINDSDYKEDIEEDVFRATTEASNGMQED
jgi:hypothetical protein